MLLWHSAEDYHNHTSPRSCHQLRSCHRVLAGTAVMTRQRGTQRGRIGLNGINLNVSFGYACFTRDLGAFHQLCLSSGEGA